MKIGKLLLLLAVIFIVVEVHAFAGDVPRNQAGDTSPIIPNGVKTEIIRGSSNIDPPKAAVTGHFPVASCKGPNGTLLSTSGTDTANATAAGEIKQDDLDEWCARMSAPSTEAQRSCQLDMQNLLKLPLRAQANCSAHIVTSTRNGAIDRVSLTMKKVTVVAVHGKLIDIPDVGYYSLRDRKEYGSACASGMGPIGDQFAIMCPNTWRSMMAVAKGASSVEAGQTAPTTRVDRFVAQTPTSSPKLYTPSTNSTERGAIMDGIRATQQVLNVKFQVASLTVARVGDRAIAVTAVLSASSQTLVDAVYMLEIVNSKWKALYAMDGGGGRSSCEQRDEIVGKMKAKAREYSAPNSLFPARFWTAQQNQDRSSECEAGVVTEF